MAVDSGRTRDGFHRPAHLRREDRHGYQARESRPANQRRDAAARNVRQDATATGPHEHRAQGVRGDGGPGDPHAAARARDGEHRSPNARGGGRPTQVRHGDAGHEGAADGRAPRIRAERPVQVRRPSPMRTAVRHGRVDGDVGESPRARASTAPVSPAPGPPVPPAEVSPQLAAEVEDAVRGAAAFVPAGAPVLAPPEPGNRAARHRARWAWEGRYLRTLLVLDLVIGFFAGFVAFEVRFGVGLTSYNLRYALLSALVPIAFTAALAVNRAYEKRYLFVGTDEYQRVLRAGLSLTAVTVFVAYAAEFQIARGWFVVAVPLVTFSCLGGRFALRQLLHRARKQQGACMRRVVVVGHELAVEAMTRQLCRERYHGLKVVGACLAAEGTVSGVPVLGTFDQIAAAVRTARADTVLVLSCPELDGHSLRRLAWRLERDDIDLIVASTLIDVAGSRTTIRPVDGLPMLHVEHPTLTGARRLVKAIFDRIGALLLLILTSPLLAGLALAVRAESKGPVLFRQVRVGKDGREFVIFKFRTMHLDAEARLAELRHLNEVDGALFKLRNDPRVTRVGRLLRKFSLDELPQLLNVLGGSMSLVGPRPPLPEEVAVYPDDARRRLAVRPGMTGLWQVSGRSDLSWDEAVRLDLQYVENWSLSLDLVIMLRTLSAVTRGAGAY
ncbi:sugar transferase [Dactylosporangium roseum]|nr:exopolysaccharide biosynthesis polyprenyl glycosylphosphotransferase [Dactylosporangium roseum]